MKKRAVHAIFMSFALLISMLAGCSKAPKQTVQPENGAVKIRIACGSSTAGISDNHPFVLWLEEQTGYDLEVQIISGLANPDMLQALLSSTDAPDVIIGASSEQIGALGQDGKLLPLQTYYKDRDGATKAFWDRLEENLTPEQQEDVLRLITDPASAEIYSVPQVTYEIYEGMKYHTWINAPWLQALELDAPTTTEELYTVLKTFKANYPNCIPLVGCWSSSDADVVGWLINSFLYFSSDKPFLVSEDGMLTPGFAQEEYRTALQFIRKLTDEGLLTIAERPNDIVTLTGAEEGQSQCGIFTGPAYLYTPYNQATDYVPLAPLTGQACPYYINATPLGVVNTNTAHPEEAVRLLMAMWTEQASLRMLHGKYSEDWIEADPDSTTIFGTPAKVKMLYDPSQRKEGLVPFPSMYVHDSLLQYTQNLSYSQEQAEKYRMTAELKALYDAAAAENNPDKVCPVLRYSNDSLQLRTAINDYFKTASVEFILGDRDPGSDEDWNAYLADLENLGLAQYTQLAQTAYDLI